MFNDRQFQKLDIGSKLRDFYGKLYSIIAITEFKGVDIATLAYWSYRYQCWQFKSEPSYIIKEFWYPATYKRNLNRS